MTLAGRAPGTVACDVRVIGVKWDLTSQVFVCMSLLTSSNGKKVGLWENEEEAGLKLFLVPFHVLSLRLPFKSYLGSLYLPYSRPQSSLLYPCFIRVIFPPLPVAARVG